VRGGIRGGGRDSGAQGAAAGPGGPGATPTAAKGAVEQIVVHGKALEGNLEGDSPDRDATVYLPPSYAGAPARRYPVLYLLHGYGGRQDTFTTRLTSIAESQDRLAPQQGFSEFIVVTPSAYTLHKGSMYSNSPTTGDWNASWPTTSLAYGQPLPHARHAHEPRPRRALDGRLRCCASA
jgi:predicted dienelactone hydrolase